MHRNRGYYVTELGPFRRASHDPASRQTLLDNKSERSKSILSFFQ